MASGSAADGQEPGASLPPSVSAFLAKVLDQLSLSAWLPGLYFACAVALLLQFRAEGNIDIGVAAHNIAEDWVAVLLLTVPTVLLAVLVIQASAFAAIQFLEGYGRPRGPGRWVRSSMIRRQVKTAQRLHRRRMLTQAEAFDRSQHKWDEPTEVLMAMWAVSRGRELPALAEAHKERFHELDWRQECEPWYRARVDEMVEREKEFPENSRILPTRLGNLLRATEDALKNADGDVAGFALRRRRNLPGRTQLQHDQFRTRLDMYSTLCLVNAALVPLAVAALAWQVGVIEIAVVGSFFALLCAVSYRAAVASARGYCSILRVMDEAGPAGPSG